MRSRIIAAAIVAGGIAAGAQAQMRQDYQANKEDVLAAVGKVCFSSGGQITHQDAYQLSCQTQYREPRAAMMMIVNNVIPVLSTEYSLVGSGLTTTVQISEYIQWQPERGSLQRNLRTGNKAEEDMRIRLGAITLELNKH